MSLWPLRRWFGVGLQFEGRAGDVLLRNLESILVRNGGIVLRGHVAEQLLAGTGGSCVGIQGRTENGAFVVMAKHTLVADGGFQMDPVLVRENIAPNPDKVLQRSARSGLGHGLRMAIAFGAGATGSTGSTVTSCRARRYTTTSFGRTPGSTISS